MQNQSPPNMGNPGEVQMPYGQPPGQGAHQGMMPMQPGMPYPYVMLPMGAPYMFMPPHPDMGNHPPMEMPMDLHHYRGPMMPMPYGMHMQHVPHHMMPMPVGPPGSQGGPPPFVPGSGHHGVPARRESIQSSHSSMPASSRGNAGLDQSTLSSQRPSPAPQSSVPPTSTGTPPEKVSPQKPVSRRLPIIDPTTGEEISISPVVVASSTSVPAIPASAMTSADIVLGVADSSAKALLKEVPVVAPPIPDHPVVEVLSVVSPVAAVGKKLPLKLKNAVLPKPVAPPSVIPSAPLVAQHVVLVPAPKTTAGVVTTKTLGMKQLNKIRNVPLVKQVVLGESPILKVSGARVLSSQETAPTPTLEETVVPPTPTAEQGLLTNNSTKFRLTNKTLSAGPVKCVAPSPAAPQTWPISRELFLEYLPLTRPDRNAPMSINVFPSELLGLRTAPHGDPGLSSRGGVGRGGGSRVGANASTSSVSLQKTMSQVSNVSWRSGKQLRGSLSRQQSRGGPMTANQIIRPSERGFKIIDQSSLSEKEKLRRQVMALLNKITVDSFSSITERIAEIEISQPWQMDVVIGLIFDKAVAEHHYCELYADMCKRLRNTWPELTGVDAETGEAVPVTFTRAIIEKCQAEFDAMPDSLAATEEEIAKARGDPQDLEMFLSKKKNRILGNMKFIAQLYLMRILSSRSIRSVVEQLLFRTDLPEEHYIECICILLHNIGGTLFETESGRAYIKQFVDRMEELTSSDHYGKRIKFLIKDIIEAAATGWSGKHGGARMVTAAKSKEAVRKDAQLEQKNSNTTKYGYQQQTTSQNTRAPTVKPVVQPAVTVLSRGAPVVAAKQPTAPAVAAHNNIPEEQWEDDDDVSEYAPESDNDDQPQQQQTVVEETERSSDEGEFTTVPVRKGSYSAHY